MLIDTLTKDSANFINLSSLMRTEHTVLFCTDDCLLVHFNESKIYIAESTLNSLDNFVSVIKGYKPDRLETTNQNIFNLLKSNFRTTYKCFQYGPFVKTKADSHLVLLRKSDLPYVISTYENETYLYQLFKRNHILGYYENNVLIGYIAKHIDGTLGALYVDPRFRKKGFGKKIILAATAYFNDPLLYSHVLDNNNESILLHKSLGINCSKEKICWMYNKEFSF